MAADAAVHPVSPTPCRASRGACRRAPARSAPGRTRAPGQRCTVVTVDDPGGRRVLPLLRGLGPVGRPLLHRGGREHGGDRVPTSTIPPHRSCASRASEARSIPTSTRTTSGTTTWRGRTTTATLDLSRHPVGLPRRLRRRRRRAGGADIGAHHPEPNVGDDDRAARHGPARRTVAAVLLGRTVADQCATPSPTPTARDRSGRAPIRTSHRSSNRPEGWPGPGAPSIFTDTTGTLWMAYNAWTAGDVGYPDGARSLRMDPLCLVERDTGPPRTVDRPRSR